MTHLLATATAAALLLGASAATAATSYRAAPANGPGPYLDYTQSWGASDVAPCRTRFSDGSGYRGCGTATGGPVGGLPGRR